jgi:hypothetical protein
MYSSYHHPRDTFQFADSDDGVYDYRAKGPHSFIVQFYDTDFKPWRVPTAVDIFHFDGQVSSWRPCGGGARSMEGMFVPARNF